MSRPARLVAILAACASTSLVSCASVLAEGEIGTPRVVGFVRGAPPLEIATGTDRSGNIYVLAGPRNVPEANVFIGPAGGGFATGCRLTKGDRVGPIGWVGFSQARQWYWSGTALVSVAPSGDCRRVLDRDPGTGADLQFRAIMPWVNDTPSKTTVVALVATPTDPWPYTAIVDLNANILTNPRPFEPDAAREVEILGAGASADRREGYVLARYKVGDDVRVDGRIYDVDGLLTSRAPIGGAANIAAYGIRGFLQANERGLVAGLTEDKRVVLFDDSGGRIVPTNGLDPVGIHAWEGSLSLVGTAGDRPVFAAISDEGEIGPVVEWSVSRRLAGGLSRRLEVTDDRQPPRRTTTFDPARAASAFPFVSAHAPPRYANDTSLLVIAGPTLGTGAAATTLIAVVPAGVAYQ